MAKRKSYKMHEDWFNLIDSFAPTNPKTELDLYRAINRFVFRGDAGDLCDDARAIFERMFCKSLKSQRTDSDGISARRSIAGSHHRGNQYTRKMEQNGTSVPKMEQNGTSVPNPLIINNNGTSVPKMEQNGTSVPKVLKTNDKSEIDSPARVYNNNNIYSSSSSPSCSARAEKVDFEVVFGWLTDDQESMMLMLKRQCGIVETDPQKMKDLLKPLAQEYYAGEKESGADFEKKGRTETKKHFKNWVASMKRLGFLKIDKDGKPAIDRSEQPKPAAGHNQNGVGSNGCRITEADYEESF